MRSPGLYRLARIGWPRHRLALRRLGGAGLLAGLVLLLRPGRVAAHGIPPGPPDFPRVLLAWSFDLLPLIAIGAAGTAYLRAVRVVNAAHPRSRFPARRTVFFLGGLLALLLALQSPIDRYEGALISVHMVQHMLLQFVAAPLLLLGAPITLALRVASPPTRAWLLSVLHSRAVRTLTHPLLTWSLFVAVNWGWQFSPLYNLAAESEIVHYLQHLVFLGSALLFWWPIAGVDPAPRKLAYPARVAYLVLAIPQNSFLGITLQNTPPDLYPHYQTLVRDWGPSVTDDLVIAGTMMWNMGAMVLAPAVLLTVAAWMRDEERRTRRKESRPEARVAAKTAVAEYRAERARRRGAQGRGGGRR